MLLMPIMIAIHVQWLRARPCKAHLGHQGEWLVLRGARPDELDGHRAVVGEARRSLDVVRRRMLFRHRYAPVM